MARLDQYYTKHSIAAACIDKLDLNAYDLIIEPSAGAGAFSQYLPKNKLIAIDIEPDDASAIKMDFLDTRPPLDYKYLVVGNPPFGKNSSLAKKFFNHAANFADVIGFILPRTFRKAKTQNRLNKNFHLISEEILPANSFHLPSGEEFDVSCVFQIWEKRSEERKLIFLEEEHEDFFVIDSDDYEISTADISLAIAKKSVKVVIDDSYETDLAITPEEKHSLLSFDLKEWKILQKYKKEFPFLFSDFKTRRIERQINWKITPDIVFRRAGARAGEITRDYKSCSLEGNLFIKVKDNKVIDIFKRMWDTWWDPKVDVAKKSVKWDTAATPSISRSELVEAYTKMKEKLNEQKE